MAASSRPPALGDPQQVAWALWNALYDGDIERAKALYEWLMDVMTGFALCLALAATGRLPGKEKK